MGRCNKVPRVRVCRVSLFSSFEFWIGCVPDSFTLQNLCRRCWGFCHRTEPDLFLFHLILTLIPSYSVQGSPRPGVLSVMIYLIRVLTWLRAGFFQLPFFRSCFYLKDGISRLDKFRASKISNQLHHRLIIFFLFIYLFFFFELKKLHHRLGQCREWDRCMVLIKTYLQYLPQVIFFSWNTFQHTQTILVYSFEPPKIKKYIYIIHFYFNTVLQITAKSKQLDYCC